MIPQRRSSLYLLELVLLLPLCWILHENQQSYMGYVKDDTFISMRYARNLAEGHGMVFNYGEKLEGYTNFLWVILTLPAYWFKMDALTWVKGMGCLFGQLGIFVTYALGRHLAGGRFDPFAWLGAAGFALSASVVLWSTAGLEPTLMAVLCGGGTLLAMQLAAAGPDDPHLMRRAVLAGVVLSLAGLCRPDAHAVVLIAAAAGVVDWARSRSRTKFKAWLVCAVVITLILGPYHLWRLSYFGSLVPNTALVKASAGPEVYAQGKEFAKDLMGFTANPGIFGLAALATLAALAHSLFRLFQAGWGASSEAHRGPLPQSARNFQRLWSAVVCVVFVLYLVKIGRDEMKWHRLYLPVFPLLLALAGDGLRWLAWADAAVVQPGAWTDRSGAGARRRFLLLRPWAVLVLGLAVPVFLVNDELIDKKRDWHNRYVTSSEGSFQKMGAYIARRSKPGDVVLFQDMGAAPYFGGDLRWVDTIGILDGTVGQEHAEVGVNPFMRNLKRQQPGGREAVREMDHRLRNYFFAQNPDWIAMVNYVGKKGRKKVRRRFAKAKGNKKKEEKIFRGRFGGHAHGIHRDPRFKDFTYEKAWMRNKGGYNLVLYRRKGAGKTRREIPPPDGPGR